VPKTVKTMKNTIIKNIIFDVDSTLVTLEGLDFLAEMKGKKRAVENLTSKAMNGQLPMRQAMVVKLNIIRPSFFELVAMGEHYVKHIVPGAREVIQQLQAKGFKVWMLTGNFQPAVGILANFLGVPLSQVITNEIFFDQQGNYLNLNVDHPLSNNHGKPKVIKSYGKKLANAVMIGDGATDLEVQGVVSKFIGFGGAVKREKVAQEAEIYVDQPDLRAVLPYLANQAKNPLGRE
jgi:phosphoserine phosphatase SerB